MATRPPQVHARPARDEWGVYDPQQAGLAALFAKLDSKDAKANAKANGYVVQPTARLRPSLRDAK